MKINTVAFPQSSILIHIQTGQPAQFLECDFISYLKLWVFRVLNCGFPKQTKFVGYFKGNSSTRILRYLLHGLIAREIIEKSLKYVVVWASEYLQMNLLGQKVNLSTNSDRKLYDLYMQIRYPGNLGSYIKKSDISQDYIMYYMLLVLHFLRTRWQLFSIIGMTMARGF